MTKPKCIVIDENLEKATMEYVKINGMKFSGLISVLLRNYLKEHGIKIEGEQIEVDSYGGTKRLD